MHKIATLKPRIGMAQLQRASVLAPPTTRVTGRRLQERRKRYFRAHPLCVECAKHERVAAAVRLDHVIPLHMGGPDDEDNWQGLCIECHDAKSETERQARQGGEAVQQRGMGVESLGPQGRKPAPLSVAGFFSSPEIPPER